MALSARKPSKHADFQANLKVEKGWVVIFGKDLLLLQLTKALIFKLR